MDCETYTSAVNHGSMRVVLLMLLGAPSLARQLRRIASAPLFSGLGRQDNITVIQPQLAQNLDRNSNPFQKRPISSFLRSRLHQYRENVTAQAKQKNGTTSSSI